MHDKTMNENEDTIRLQVYLAHAGIASRRTCEALIAAGHVTVNGQCITEMGYKVAKTDHVAYKGKPVFPETQKQYVLLHKPAGFVCTLSDEKGRPTAADLLKPYYRERLYNIGRLDMFSSGALIFTNDGDFSAAIEHPSSCIEKEYVIETSQNFDEKLLVHFEKGVRIEGIFYKCLMAQSINKRKMRIVLVEGKNREIRRILQHFNCTIKRLVRIRIGTVLLEPLKAGEFRNLTEKEKHALLTTANRACKKRY